MQRQEVTMSRNPSFAKCLSHLAAFPDVIHCCNGVITAHTARLYLREEAFSRCHRDSQIILFFKIINGILTNFYKFGRLRAENVGSLSCASLRQRANKTNKKCEPTFVQGCKSRMCSTIYIYIYICIYIYIPHNFGLRCKQLYLDAGWGPRSEMRSESDANLQGNSNSDCVSL
jgi:hypothetical protein